MESWTLCTTDVLSTSRQNLSILAAYSGLTEEGANVYNQNRNCYQYIVTFNSNLGDLPSLQTARLKRRFLFNVTGVLIDIFSRKTVRISNNSFNFMNSDTKSFGR